MNAKIAAIAVMWAFMGCCLTLVLIGAAIAYYYPERFDGAWRYFALLCVAGVFAGWYAFKRTREIMLNAPDRDLA